MFYLQKGTHFYILLSGMINNRYRKNNAKKPTLSLNWEFPCIPFYVMYREADCYSSFASVTSGPVWGVLFSPPAALLKPLLS